MFRAVIKPKASGNDVYPKACLDTSGVVDFQTISARIITIYTCSKEELGGLFRWKVSFPRNDDVRPVTSQS